MRAERVHDGGDARNDVGGAAQHGAIHGVPKVIVCGRGRMITDDSERISERVGVLFDTMRAFAEAEIDYDRLLTTVTERITDLFGDGCVVFARRDDKAKAAAFYDRDPRVIAALGRSLAKADLPIEGNTITARVIKTGKPVFLQRLDPVTLHPDILPEYATVVRELGVRSLLCVPLQVGGRTTGALTLIRHEEAIGPFENEHLKFAQNVASYVALALANAELFESAQRELRDRRRAEEETKQFVALVQHSREFIAMAAFDGRVLFVNDAGRKLVGLDPECDVTALTLEDFHTEEGLKRADILLAKGRWEGHGYLRHFVTGELIPTDVNSLIVHGKNGEPLCFATVQRDLRETRKLEEHLRQVQKMEAIGRLAGGVAHDFNNLLSVIISYGSLVLKSLDEDSPIRADVQEILTAGDRAANLTRKLLAFSRQQVLEPRVANLSDVVAGMANMLRRIVGEDVELETRSGPDLGNVKVDTGQIEQVILNLTVNARDAMPAGGKLTVTLENEAVEEAAPSASGPAPGQYVLLSVTDTGTGMDEATKSRIFEPFFTTKPVGKGTGLGLATVFGVVKQSGGYLSVASGVGEGTTFKIHLPRWTGDVPEPASAHTATDLAPRTR